MKVVRSSESKLRNALAHPPAKRSGFSAHECGPALNTKKILLDTQKFTCQWRVKPPCFAHGSQGRSAIWTLNLLKLFRFSAGVFVLILAFSVLIIAQTEKAKISAASKIAFINTEAFDNKETGIKEIVEVYDKIEAEFKLQAEELKLLGEKIQKLQERIKEINNTYEPRGLLKELESKIKELDLLIPDYKFKENAARALYNKRKAEIFADVNKKVSDAVKQFAKEKSYAIILDSSKDTSFIIIEGEIPDVTKEFIRFYNENFANVP